MDIDTGNLLGSSHLFATHKKANNAQLSEGLMRYHSAPSSVLAGLLDDDLFPAGEDSELAQLLGDGVGSFSSLLDPKGLQQAGVSPTPFTGPYGHTRSAKDPKYVGSCSSSHDRFPPSILSSISEHGPEETCDTYHAHQALQRSSSDRSTGPLPDLIGQSSSPSSFLSRQIKEESNINHLSHTDEKLGSHSFIPTTQVASIGSFAEVQCMNKAHPAKSMALLRQSSSPAGLLSQVNCEDFSTPGNPTSEALFDGRGSLSGSSHAASGWPEGMAESAMQDLTAYSQRKRGRAIGMQVSSEVGNAFLSNFTTPSSSSTGNIDCLEGSLEDSVLCKVRAKRGCATHPRSIAERQRRIKISERMKKLQDLVPNLDKQANTAEMLDEVVEYVKLLQRQVQELSLNRPSCTGACQQDGKPPG